MSNIIGEEFDILDEGMLECEYPEYDLKFGALGEKKNVAKAVDWSKFEGVPMSQEHNVELDGYESLEQQVERMQRAGIDLANWRFNQYPGYDSDEQTDGEPAPRYEQDPVDAVTRLARNFGRKSKEKKGDVDEKGVKDPAVEPEAPDGKKPVKDAPAASGEKAADAAEV
jgi:hypothetical protein